ncbi:MAG: MFS transporter [Acidimicrobiia bacterium]
MAGPRPSVRAAAAVLAVAAAAAGVSQAFGRFTFSLLFTDVRDDLGLSNTSAGTLGSANLLAYLTGTLVVSLVVGRAGLGRTARTGVAGVTAGLLLLAWAPNAAVTAVALVITGLFAAGVWVTVPAIATAQVGAGRRGTAIGLVGAGIGVGIVVASLLHGTADADRWRQVYRVEAAVALVVTVAGLRLLRHGEGTGSRPGPGTGRGGGSGFAAVRAVPGWRRLLGSYGLFAVAMSLMVTFLVAVLKEDAGYRSSAASLAFSMFGVGTIAGGPLFGPLADRLGRARALHLAYAVMAGTAVVIGSGARPWATFAALAFGTAFTAVPTTVAARLSDVVAAERFGAAYGVATLAFGAGLMVGPQLGGALGDATGSFRPVFWLAAAVAIIAGLLIRPGDAPAPPGRPARRPTADTAGDGGR